MIIVCKCTRKRADRDAARHTVDRAAQGKKGYSLREEKEDDDEVSSEEDEEDNIDYGIKGRDDIN